jgi:hypothetical protein
MHGWALLQFLLSCWFFWVRDQVAAESGSPHEKRINDHAFHSTYAQTQVHAGHEED